MSKNTSKLATIARCTATGATPEPISEPDLARQYPLSRWYLRPAAGWLAAMLVSTRIRPVHLTYCGLLAAAAAVVTLGVWPGATPIAGGFVLVYWFFDRADGQLARRQRTVSPWGAWLDANVDELADVALHVAVAAVIAASLFAPWAWLLLVAFLGGKYLLMYGLMLEEAHAVSEEEQSKEPIKLDPREAVYQLLAADDRRLDQGPSEPVEPVPKRPEVIVRWIREAYHLLGNADVRTHLLAVALLTGCLTAELALVAVYYNVRWIARYLLVARRLGATA